MLRTPFARERDLLRGYMALLSTLTLGLPAMTQAEALPGAPAPPAALAKRLSQVRAEAPRTRHLDDAGRPRFTNRLALEASPYLRQHAHNPVNWYPWGEEAFEQARKLGRPIFLSIGYSTCHWCHVMEEESFEDLEIAKFLNQNFIAIKVDREERPDIDAIYMTAVQAMTGRGGWPMSVFVTTDRTPFYGGTYFPPRSDPRRGPGFLELIQQVASVYANDRAQIEESTARATAFLAENLQPPEFSSAALPGAREIRRALSELEASFDAEQGGVGKSQKFPSSLPIRLLLRAARRGEGDNYREMATRTLDAMARGGIYDHVGGGFHRYTVDRTWTVPHFEKMLYDNALLAMAYLEGHQATGRARYAEVVRDTLRYVSREMTAPAGTFYSATDADSEGEEGRFFVWTREQVTDAVGPERAKLALRAYGLDGEPNFEQRAFVLRRDRSVETLAGDLGLSRERVAADLVEIRARLAKARSQRVAPLRDDKQLVSWNGLMISAFARAALALGDEEHLERAEAAARHILEQGRPDGHLARYLLDGKPHGTGLLDDHAYLISGLLDLFEATSEARWLEAARALQAELDARFIDPGIGGYFTGPDDGEALIVRAKTIYDDARPSPNAVATENLLRLHYLTTERTYLDAAERSLRAFAPLVEREPRGAASMLEATDAYLDRPREILIVTPNERAEAGEFLAALGASYVPTRVVVATAEPQIPSLAEQIPLLEGKLALGGRTTAYVCTDQVCKLPARDVETFTQQIREPAVPYPAPEESAAPVQP